MNEDIDIINEEVYEFEIPNQEFIIEYNKTLDTWIAIHNDEDKYDYGIIIEEKDFSNGNIELFDNYNLDIKFFNKLKELIKE